MIDGFRGVAILSVLMFHYLVRWRMPEYNGDLLGYDVRFSAFFDVGRFGVQLFFVISGLVITMTLQGAKSAGAFAVKRFARIYPAFLVAMPLTFLIMSWIGPEEMQTEWSDVVANLTLFPEELGRQYVDGAYWSLNVELKFYAWMTVFRLILGSRFWIGALALAVAGQIVAQVNHSIASFVMINAHMPLFLLGIGGWFAIYEKRIRLGALLMAAAPILWCFAVAGGGVYGADLNHLAPHLFIWLLSAAMLGLLAFAPDVRFGALAWVGRISYSLYLVHQNIGVTLIGLMKRAHAPDWIAFIVSAGFSVALAALIYRFVEGPAKSWILGVYNGLRAPREARAGAPPD